MYKDKIVMDGGFRITYRTYFLKDLKVGDELVGYSSYWGTFDKYIVDSISRKYATLKCGGKEYKMSFLFIPEEKGI